MIHRKDAENAEEIIIFSFVAETPTIEIHHASGNRFNSKFCPKGVGLFLFALLSEKE